MSSEFGDDYVNTSEIGGHAIFSDKTKERIHSFRDKDPRRYPRPVDTLVFEHLGAIIARDDAYKRFFKEALEHEFPYGAQHVRRMINIIGDHRNALYHANSLTLSLHDVERVLCYCNDLISSIKSHYSKMSLSDKFPAPTLTRYSDWLGNVRYLNEPRSDLLLADEPLFVGDIARFEVEVDSSYSPDEYTIVWRSSGLEIAQGPVLLLTLELKHVGQYFGLQVDVTSNKAWHRIAGRFDAVLTLRYEVLPVPRTQ
ncbi:hypothetical protein [Caballeronia sp. LjRoot29]|uniref:hypothetical protein n=1 Tax=Caballeronia sp. LjRoot29 TaxID=3342315 RepID=UPI003F501B02